MSDSLPPAEPHEIAPLRDSTRIDRRTLLAGAAGAVGATVAGQLLRGDAAAAQDAIAPPDPTKVQGVPPSPVGARSPFEKPTRSLYSYGSGTRDKHARALKSH